MNPRIIKAYFARSMFGEFAMLLTQQELATKSGYSRKTVSKALQGHPDVPELTREKILAMARKYAYRPSSAARAIRDNRTKLIGVVFRNAPDRPLENPASAEFLMGINSQLAAEGYLAVLVRVGDVAKALGGDSRVFQERVVDGMIFSGAISDDILSHVHELMHHCIFMDTNRWEPTDCLQRDEFAAGLLCAQRVIQAGYRRLIWFGAIPKDTTKCHYCFAQRYAGVGAAAKEAGVSLVQVNNDYCADTPELWKIYTDRVKRLVAADVALITCDGLSAQRCALAAAEMRLTAPGDFGLASCDDSHTVAITWPGLSRVGFDRFEMGVTAAEMMMRQLNDDNQGKGIPSVKMPVKWIAGATLRMS